MLQDVVATAGMQGRDDDVIQSLCLLFVSEVSVVVIFDQKVGKEHMTVIVIVACGEALTKMHVLDLVKVVLVGESHICVLGDAAKEWGSVCELETAVVNVETVCLSDEAVDVSASADCNEPKRSQPFKPRFRPGQVQA